MKNIDISIVCAYYNRKQLFERTLQSIKIQLEKLNAVVEVIAVDDGSDEVERLEDLQSEYPFLKIIRLEKKEKWYTNSCIPFNIGFQNAAGKIIIIQNPECLHHGNILTETMKISDNQYISFACFSLGIESTNQIDNYLNHTEKLERLIGQNNVGYIGDGLDCWYNHSIKRPCAYHFCTVILKKDLDKLGGFDERFAFGVAYDDNEFLHRVKILGLSIKFVDNVFVLHQNHYNKPSALNNVSLMDEKMLRKRNKLVERNKKLYESVILKSSSYEARKVSSIKKILVPLFNLIKS